MTQAPSTANDNFPAHRIGALSGHPRAFETADVESLRQQISKQRHVISEKLDSSDYQPVWESPSKPINSATIKRDWPFIGASLVWVGTLAANIWAIASAPLNSLHLIIVLAAMWASLLVTYLANARGRKALTEIAALSGLICFGLAIYVTSLRFGLFINNMASTGLGICAALAIALACRSTLALRAALPLTTVACIIGFQGVQALQEGRAALSMQPYLWSLPFIWAAGLFTAHKLEDKFSTILVGLIGFGWSTATAYSAYSQTMITPIMALTAVALLGLAYSRMGKLLEDTENFVGSTHTLWGWAALMSAALLIEHLWLADPTGLLANADFKATAQPTWAALIALCLIATLCIELKRSQTRPQSPLIAISLTLIAGGFVWACLNYNAIHSYLTSLNLAYLPTAGLVLGGALTALSFAMILNGSKRRNIPMFLTGLIALSVQALLSFKAIGISIESIMIFGVSVFVTLMIALMFTRRHGDT